MQVTELFDKPLSLVSAPRRIAAPANGAAASVAPRNRIRSFFVIRTGWCVQR